MRRLSAALLLLAAACSAGGGPLPPPPPETIGARFAPGGAQDVIEVTMRDPRAARSVALVGPGGPIATAYAIETRPAGHSVADDVGLAPGPSPGFGIRGAPSATTRSDEAMTVAFVRVPDIYDYRRNWRAYRIRLEIGTAPDSLRAVDVPAPPPG
jgi:hypothetical protein